MKNSIILTEEKDIATISLNRPKKKNAISYEMWKLLKTRLDKVNNKKIRLLILKGVDNTVFSSGADVKEFLNLRNTSEGARVYNQALKEAIEKLQDIKVPTIAFIQGYCVGAGLELAIACDIRVVDETAKFALTPAKVGLINNPSSIEHLVNLVGPSIAKDMIFSAKTISAKEANKIGLINYFYPSNEIDDRVYEYCQTISSLSQNTIKGSKWIINSLFEYNDNKQIEAIALKSFESEDYQEGVNAFIEKRTPQFKYKL